MATVSIRCVFDSERFLVHRAGPKSLTSAWLPLACAAGVLSKTLLDDMLFG